MRRIALVLALAWQAGAQPLPNPPFTINRKIQGAQADRGGRVELAYDLRGWPAQALLVTCYRLQVPGPPIKIGQWRYDQPRGNVRLDARSWASGEYLFDAQLLGPQDQPLTLATRPVHLEYGDWSARLRNQEASQRASLSEQAPFGVLPQAEGQPSEWDFKVTPDALVLRPGQVAGLVASLNGRPVAEALAWQLEGPGRLQPVDNYQCLYQADPGSTEGQRAVIRVVAPGHPTRLRQEIQILVSSEAKATRNGANPAPGL